MLLNWKTQIALSLLIIWIIWFHLSNNKEVNFSGVGLSIKDLTNKDREDLMFGLDQRIDWIALSFVSNPQDLIKIKGLISSTGKWVPVIAKIEKHEVINQIDEVLPLFDWGVELPAEDIPVLQKRLIIAANRLGVPIITATHVRQYGK